MRWWEKGIHAQGASSSNTFPSSHSIPSHSAGCCQLLRAPGVPRGWMGGDSHTGVCTVPAATAPSPPLLLPCPCAVKTRGAPEAARGAAGAGMFPCRPCQPCQPA